MSVGRNLAPRAPGAGRGSYHTIVTFIRAALHGMDGPPLAAACLGGFKPRMLHFVSFCFVFFHPTANLGFTGHIYKLTLLLLS